MPPIDHPCPQCNAQPGERCRHYLGRACAPHHDRGTAPKGKQTHAPSPGLFDAIPAEPAPIPAGKVYCSWCGDVCPPGRVTCDAFCARMEARAARPLVVFLGNQDIPWEDDQQ
jgi:hypothetical protein